MKKECNIVKDLLPLYVDNICSEESKLYIEKHLKTCNECSKELQLIKENVFEDNNIIEINENEALLNAGKKMKKIRFVDIIKTIITTIFVMLIIIGILYIFVGVGYYEN